MANLYLVGLPGAGKTTVGRIVAHRLGLRFVDLDRLIAEREGKSERELLAAGVFREKETEALRWVSRQCDRCVVATGGGIVEREENVEILRGGIILYVVRHPRSILSTLNTDKRPSFEDDPNRIYSFARHRVPRFEKISDFRVTNNHTLRACIEKVLVQLHRRDFPNGESSFPDSLGTESSVSRAENRKETENESDFG